MTIYNTRKSFLKQGVRKMQKKIVIFGYGARGQIYANYALSYPEEYEVTAIVEVNKDRIKEAKAKFSCPVYTDYKQMLADKPQADIIAVATQDDDHEEHAIACMKAGYDLLLEKPISNSLKGCKAIYKASKKYGRKVIVCHVLRYTPFYRRVKEILDAGKVGEIITVQASENVGYYHQAHSFVRGPWKNSKTSSPMILAKCCHDMDILRWLVGKPCLSLSSMGSLRHFRPDQKPAGAAAYCSKCPVQGCVYRAQDIYKRERFFATYFSTAKEEADMLKDLENSDYDKCVYQSGNDVVDHQVTIMQCSDEVTICHSMTAFSKEIYRDLKIHGTKAELVGVMEKNYIEIRPYDGEVETITWEDGFSVGGHGGGDQGMMHEVYLALNGEETKGVSYLDVSIDSHLMSFAAEASRKKKGKVVKIKK